MEDEKICNTCAHYHVHYLLSPKGQYTQAAIGHCGTPRMKPRDYSRPACAYYSPKAKERT